MHKKLILILLLIPAITALLPICVDAQNRMIDFDIGESDYIAPPRIIKPSTDAVDLRGRDCLEFSWSPHEGDSIKREYYDLRIYKGYQAYGSARVYLVRVPPRQWSICISSDIFEDGAVYTCALRQVYRGQKSKRSFQSFKVIKSQEIYEGPR